MENENWKNAFIDQSNLTQLLEKANEEVKRLESVLSQQRLDLENEIASLRNATAVDPQYADPTPAEIEKAWDEVYIFIDYSNIHIGTHRSLGEKTNERRTNKFLINLEILHNLLMDIANHPGREFHMGVVAGNGNLLKPERHNDLTKKFVVTTADKEDKGFRSLDFTEKSKYRFATTQGSKEDVIDHMLHAEILQAQLHNLKETPKLGRTMIIVTGDANRNEGSTNFPKLVNDLLAMGWKVEVHSLAKSLGGALRFAHVHYKVWFLVSECDKYFLTTVVYKNDVGHESQVLMPVYEAWEKKEKGIVEFDKLGWTE